MFAGWIYRVLEIQIRVTFAHSGRLQKIIRGLFQSRTDRRVNRYCRVNDKATGVGGEVTLIKLNSKYLRTFNEPWYIYDELLIRYIFRRASPAIASPSEQIFRISL